MQVFFGFLVVWMQESKNAENKLKGVKDAGDLYRDGSSEDRPGGN